MYHLSMIEQQEKNHLVSEVYSILALSDGSSHVHETHPYTYLYVCVSKD